MSRAVCVSDVPDDARRALRARAAAAGVSISNYLREEVMTLASHPPVADVLMRAGTSPGGVSPAAITAAIRADRDA